MNDYYLSKPEILRCRESEREVSYIKIIPVSDTEIRAYHLFEDEFGVFFRHYEDINGLPVNEPGDQSYLGCLLFDANGYWVFDGRKISVDTQEQAASFISNYHQPLAWKGALSAFFGNGRE